MTSYQTLLDALQAGGYKLGSHNGVKAQAQCPGHDDRNPSLSITHHGDKTLIYCHGECGNDIDRILAPLKLTPDDLFDNLRPTYTYTYANGKPQRRVHRNPGKQFYQSGDQNIFLLYGIPRIREFKAAGQPIHLVEGEKDADTVNHLGGCGTTGPQGANSVGQADISELKDADVIAVRDLDDAGLKWAEEVQLRVGPIAKSLVFKVAAAGKDVSNHIAAGHPLEELRDDPTRPRDTGRWIDLTPYLDGTYTPPDASLGACREDGTRFLYPGRWHTLTGLTTAGKTFWALWHAKAMMEHGGHVSYIHFEEPDPAGTIQRLKDMGVNPGLILSHFHWSHLNRPYDPGEMARELKRLPATPHLCVLDGILAACGHHGWAIKEPESVGEYRRTYVHPLTQEGVAVLSLGHPVKDRTRQGESYSYGAAGWLNDVDGVSYRMQASKTPLTKGKSGSSAVHVVKDRYSEVQRWGVLNNSNEMPWWYMGQFIVDDTKKPQEMRMSIPDIAGGKGGGDNLDVLGEQVIEWLLANTGRFETLNKLATKMRAAGHTFAQSDLGPALERLVLKGDLIWPEAGDRKPRPGWLSPKAGTWPDEAA